jgi:hypothetical protein
MKKLLLLLAVASSITAIAQNKRLNVQTHVSGSMQTFSLYLKQTDNSYSLLKTRDEDSGGWIFDSLSAGNYRVHVEMAYTKYISTWYPSAPIWDEAVDIVLADDSMGVSVSMIPNPSLSGPATINGQLNEGLLKTAGDPLKNTRVVIKDGANAFVKMVSTNDSGKFTVANLPVGQYKILVDVINVPTNNPKTVTLDSANLNASIDLTVNSTGTVKTGLRSVSAEKAAISLYPNPATDLIRSTSLESMRMEVYNITGAMVANGMISATQELSLGHLANGLYIATLTKGDGSKVSTQRIVKY